MWGWLYTGCSIVSFGDEFSAYVSVSPIYKTSTTEVSFERRRNKLTCAKKNWIAWCQK